MRTHNLIVIPLLLSGSIFVLGQNYVCDETRKLLGLKKEGPNRGFESRGTIIGVSFEC